MGIIIMDAELKVCVTLILHCGRCVTQLNAISNTIGTDKIIHKTQQTLKFILLKQYYKLASNENPIEFSRQRI